MSMFGRSYNEVEKEQARQEEVRAQIGKRIWRFYLPAAKDGDASAPIRFLTHLPITYYEHTVQNKNNKGKTVYDNYTCIAGEKNSVCPYCEQGLKPSFRVAFLIWDARPYEVTVKGKKEMRDGALRLYVAGTRVASQLKRIDEKYGLLNYEFIINRDGVGTSTTYSFDREDKVSPFSAAEIINMLPEALREDVDTSSASSLEESLMQIIEGQLMMSLAGNASMEDEDEEDEAYDTSHSTVTVEDDEEKPAKKPLFSSKFRKK